MIPAVDPKLFVGVDYAKLETRIMRAAAKQMNFGSPRALSGMYGMEPKYCKRCGEEVLYSLSGHDRRRCTYRVTSQRYQRVGYVPITGFAKKAFKHAGITLHWGTGLSQPEGTQVYNLRRKREKPRGPRALQKAYYAPVWAAILFDMSGVGALTSPRRPLVKELINKLRRTSEDPDEQALLMGEHILGRGPYTVACQALIGRLMR